MTRYKDYYGGKNSKSMKGSKVFFGLVKIATWMFVFIVAGLVDVVRYLYKAYQEKKYNKRPQ